MKTFTAILVTILGVALLLGAATSPESWPPPVTLPEALRLAEQFVRTNKFDTSQQYISGVGLQRAPNGTHYWEVGWFHTNKMVRGGFFHIRVHMDKTITHHPGK